MAAIADTLRMHVEIAVNGVCASGGAGTTTIVNVYHFKRTTNTNTLSKANIQAAFKTAIADPVCAFLNVDYLTSTHDVRFIDDPEDPVLKIADAEPGAIAGERFSSFNAAVMILKSNTRGAWAQGRKHFAPVSESDAGEDIISAGILALMATVRTNMLAGFTDSNGNVWKFGVLSRTYSDLTVSPANPVVFTPITSILINKTLGIMRNRKRPTVR